MTDSCIRRLLDAMAVGRDAMIAAEPIYRFEQASRRQRVVPGDDQ